MNESKTVRIQKLLEDNLLRPEAQEERIEELAKRIAETIVMLTSAMHNPIKEKQQEEKIQDQVLRTKIIQIRDAKTLKNLIYNLTLATTQKEALWKETDEILKEYTEQVRVIEEIQTILKDKNQDKINQLTPLIKELIRLIKETEDNLKKEDNIIKK